MQISKPTDPGAKRRVRGRNLAGPLQAHQAVAELPSGTLWLQLVGLAPKIKTPIQLAGFLFSVLAAAIIQHLNPSNIQALVVVGAIGVSLVTIPLLFHPAMLKMFQPTQRLVLVLATLTLLLFSFGALAVITREAVILAPQGARFDSELEPSKVRVIQRNSDGSARIEILWHLFPITKHADQSATIFIGMVVLHDEDAVKQSGIGAVTTKTCREEPSCVGSRVFNEYAERPIYVRGDSTGTNLTTTVDLRRLPQNLRIWWEFFQLEGKDGARCGIDHRRPKPAEGIPPLAMFDAVGKIQNLGCYLSFGQRTIQTG